MENYSTFPGVKSANTLEQCDKTQLNPVENAVCSVRENVPRGDVWELIEVERVRSCPPSTTATFPNRSICALLHLMLLRLLRMRAANSSQSRIPRSVSCLLLFRSSRAVQRYAYANEICLRPSQTSFLYARSRVRYGQVQRQLGWQVFNSGLSNGGKQSLRSNRGRRPVQL